MNENIIYGQKLPGCQKIDKLSKQTHCVAAMEAGKVPI